jgi:hypothetical protein
MQNLYNKIENKVSNNIHGSTNTMITKSVPSYMFRDSLELNFQVCWIGFNVINDIHRDIKYFKYIHDEKHTK